jgi:hypothetical protein
MSDIDTLSSQSDYSLLSLFENSDSSDNFVFVEPIAHVEKDNPKSKEPNKETLQDILNSLKIEKEKWGYKMIINGRGRKEIVPILEDGDEYESGEEIDEIDDDDNYNGYSHYKNGPDDVYQ